jgi:DNA polymerase I
MSKRRSKRKPKLLVVDGMNFLYRGFHAIEGAKLRDPNYVPNKMNAVVGLVSILLADLRFLETEYCAIIFDRPGGNFRYDLYPEYKAHRVDTIGLSSIVTRARKLLRAAGFAVFGIRGEEGDDVIGSVAHTLSDPELERPAHAYIASTDKDFAALVYNDRIHLLRPKREEMDEDGVFEKYNVWPEQIIEYLMLMGDGVDNIPGVKGVAAKTASRLLTSHSSLRHILKVKHTPALAANLKAAKPMFKLTRKLVTIKTDCLPDIQLSDVRIKGIRPEFDKLCDRYELRRTKSEILRYYSE